MECKNVNKNINFEYCCITAPIWLFDNIQVKIYYFFERCDKLDCKCDPKCDTQKLFFALHNSFD